MAGEKAKPKSSKTTYEYDTVALARLFAEHLCVSSDRVAVEYVMADVGDDRFGVFSGPECVGVQVTVRGEP